MPLNSNQPQKRKKTTPRLNPFLFSGIKYVVSSWHGYIQLHSWAIVFMGIVILLTRQLFSINGLILSIGILLYILLAYLDKWISKQEKKG